MCSKSCHLLFIIRIYLKNFKFLIFSYIFIINIAEETKPENFCGEIKLTVSV